MRYLPTIACARQLHLAEDIKELLNIGLNYIHFDIMDGNYVPNFCLSIDTAEQLKEEFPEVMLDVHLMVMHPEYYVERLARAGTKSMSFHLSSTNFVYRMIESIHNFNMKAGVAINPSESIYAIEPVIRQLDYVLLMCVEPGFSGQRFIEESYSRLDTLVQLRKDKKVSFEIFLDGGITPEISYRLIQHGADGIVLGYPFLFNQRDGITGAWQRYQNNFPAKLKGDM